MIEIKLFSFLPKTRTANPVSKFLRPFMESKRIKISLGSALSAASIMAGSFWLPSKTLSTNETITSWGDVVIEMETERGIGDVLPEKSGVSQGFGYLHQGADLTAPEGSAIYAIKPGRVIEVGFMKYGYGRYVVLDHDNKQQSLYAHMGKIMVEEGESVSLETKLGEVGLTGRTTGYHLHLELISDFRRVNPLPYLELSRIKTRVSYKGL